MWSIKPFETKAVIKHYTDPIEHELMSFRLDYIWFNCGAVAQYIIENMLLASEQMLVQCRYL